MWTDTATVSSAAALAATAPRAERREPDGPAAAQVRQAQARYAALAGQPDALARALTGKPLSQLPPRQQALLRALAQDLQAGRMAWPAWRQAHPAAGAPAAGGADALFHGALAAFVPGQGGAPGTALLARGLDPAVRDAAIAEELGEAIAHAAAQRGIEVGAGDRGARLAAALGGRREFRAEDFKPRPEDGTAVRLDGRVQAALAKAAAAAHAKQPLRVEFPGGKGFELRFVWGKGKTYVARDQGKGDGQKGRPGYIELPVNQGYTGRIDILAPGGKPVLGQLTVTDYGGPKHDIALKGSGTHQLRRLGGAIRVERKPGSGQAHAKSPLRLEFAGHPGFELHFPLPNKKVYVARDGGKGDGAPAARGFLQMPVNLGYTGNVKVMTNGKQAATLVIKDYGKKTEDLKLDPKPGYRPTKTTDGALRLEKIPAVTVATLSEQTLKLWQTNLTTATNLVKTNTLVLKESGSPEGLKEALINLFRSSNSAAMTLNDANEALRVLRPGVAQKSAEAIAQQVGALADELKNTMTSVAELYRTKKRMLVDEAKNKRTQAILDIVNSAIGGMAGIATAYALAAGFANGVKNYIPIVKEKTDRLAVVNAELRTPSSARTQAEMDELLKEQKELQNFSAFWAKQGVYSGLAGGALGSANTVYGLTSTYSMKAEDVRDQLKAVSELKKSLNDLGKRPGEKVFVDTALKSIDATLQGSAGMRAAVIEALPSETLADGFWGPAQGTGNWHDGFQVVDTAGVAFGPHAESAKVTFKLLAWMLAKQDDGGKWWGRSGNFSQAEVKFGRTLQRHLHAMNKPPANNPTMWRIDLGGALATLKQEAGASEWKKDPGAHARFKAMLEHMVQYHPSMFGNVGEDRKVKSRHTKKEDDENSGNAPNTTFHLIGQM